MSASELQDILPEVVLRIPGQWNSPEDLMSTLPEGYQIIVPGDRDVDEVRLMMPDGGAVWLRALAADTEFPGVFASACKSMLSPRDRDIVEHYTFNICLRGQGGSQEAARRLLDAGAAIIHAGGAGVFVDNSVTAHGSDDWLALANDEGPGGTYWAFIATIGDQDQVWSHGMQVLGLRDAVMPRTGDDAADFAILHEFLGYTYQSGETIADGDLVGDESTALFRVRDDPDGGGPGASEINPDSPVYNPYGRWRLERVDPEDV